ncbi:hypothetical protein VTG60DRAFT_3695 [Thermothelomyces hinnuleus]
MTDFLANVQALPQVERFLSALSSSSQSTSFGPSTTFRRERWLSVKTATARGLLEVSFAPLARAQAKFKPHDVRVPMT